MQGRPTTWTCPKGHRNKTTKKVCRCGAQRSMVVKMEGGKP